MLLGTAVLLLLSLSLADDELELKVFFLDVLLSLVDELLLLEMIDEAAVNGDALLLVAVVFADGVDEFKDE